MTGPRLGLDIGGTSLVAVAADDDGQVLAHAQASTPAQAGPTALLDTAADLVRDVIRHLDIPVVTELGVGTAGVVDPDTGIIAAATTALRDWAGTNVRVELSRRLNDAQIVVVNDVHAFALAEATYGAARDFASVVALTVGTGVGGAVLIDGSPHRGHQEAAGHIGHVTVPQAAGLPCPCGSTGHLEAVASGPAMVARLRTAGMRVDTGYDVGAAYTAGDPRATDVVNDAGTALGVAIATATTLVDPAVVVIGGGALGITPDLLSTARRAYRTSALPRLVSIPIRAAELDLPVALGAATLTGQGAPCTT